MNYDIPMFASKDELFKHLKANKSIILTQKKSAIKYADACGGVVMVDNSADAFKGYEVAKEIDTNRILAKVVINTTKIMDSHDDVHFDGLWKKSLQESKGVYHLQEHNMKFDSVISDDVVAYTKSMSWKSLGFDYEGNTQALIFDSTIAKERNEFMFAQYVKGYVKNHSVGMQYVKIDMAINSEEKYYADEKAVWDKYFSQIVNKELAEDKGYFFAVTEAKAIEGSAVLRGSNIATPTISITEATSSTSDKIEPSKDTQRIDFKKLSQVKIYNN